MYLNKLVMSTTVALPRPPARRMTDEQAEQLESTFEKLRAVLPPEMAAQLPPLDLPKGSSRGASRGTSVSEEAVQVLAAAKTVSALQARCLPHLIPEAQTLLCPDARLPCS